eukprot:m51a1_g11967 putative alcohol dehydrogenase (357) ;mRNA; r:818382-819452
MATTQQVKAYSASSSSAPLAQTTIQRRKPTAHDVQIEILFCGVCHSDVHTAHDDWHEIMPTVYPCVPGHEIVGRVVLAGPEVTKHKVGDIVGVGCLVDSDRACPMCHRENEQLCPGAVFTYNSPDRHLGGVTYGGYSEGIVVDERFVFSVPGNLSLPGVAPLLCAGITTYSPLRHAGIRAGMRVGIAGLGGLGHMGVKFARAMGAHVVVLTHSPGKKDDALRLGAHDVALTTDAEEMRKRAYSLDFILDTVSADHDVNVLLGLLTIDGKITLVGAPSKPLQVGVYGLLFGRRSIGGSAIGGTAETQEMLDFCGKHGITADVEVIPIQRINEAYDRMLRFDVKYRFSIDMSSLKSSH